MIIICLWHKKIPGCFGPSIYHYIIDEAKELLKTWFQRDLKEEDKESVQGTVKQMKTTSINIGNENIAIESKTQSGLFITQQERKYKLDLRPNMVKPFKKECLDESIIFNNIPQINGN